MQITDEQVKQLGTLADTCDNLVGGTNLPLPAEERIAALKTGLEKMSAQLKHLVVSISGDDPWEGFS